MTGDQLEISRIDSDVETSSSTTGVIVTETVGIIVPVDLLKCHTADGIIVRVYGQRDTFDIFVPGYYIDGFLSRIPAD